jgi:hypothetical protein
MENDFAIELEQNLCEQSEEEKPIFNKEYCDTNNIRAEWFKFDDTLANLLCALVGESKNEKGEFVLSDNYLLSYTIYAIIQYFICGSIPAELESLLNKPTMKLSKLAVSHAIKQIEIARSRVAENRHNARKGGKASRREKQ